VAHAKLYLSEGTQALVQVAALDHVIVAYAVNGPDVGGEAASSPIQHCIGPADTGMNARTGLGGTAKRPMRGRAACPRSRRHSSRPVVRGYRRHLQHNGKRIASSPPTVRWNR